MCSRHRLLNSPLLEATQRGAGARPHRSRQLKSVRDQAGLQLTKEAKGEPHAVMPMPTTRSSPPHRSACPRLTQDTQRHRPCLERKAAQLHGSSKTSQQLSLPAPATHQISRFPELWSLTIIKSWHTVSLSRTVLTDLWKPRISYMNISSLLCKLQALYDPTYFTWL